MKTFVIKNIEGKNLYVAEANSFKEAVEEAVATGIDLTGADLGGADLRGANLFKANLSGADLEGADLRGANLSEAILTGADLGGANLEGADLVRADLTGDIVKRYDLSNTSLENLASLEQKIVNWAEDRGLITPENSKNQFLKTIEEVGELASALAKNDKEALIDAVGDVIVTLVILAKCENLSATDCLASAYKEIKDRKGKTEGGVFIKD